MPRRITAPADAALAIASVEAHGAVASVDEDGAKPVDEDGACGRVVSVAAVALEGFGSAAGISREVRKVGGSGVGGRSGKPGEGAVAVAEGFSFD